MDASDMQVLVAVAKGMLPMGSLRGTGREKPYKPLINEHTFHACTKASFSPCRRPKRKADHYSKNGSQYWILPDGVIRKSDHWGLVGTCIWTHPRSRPGDDGVRRTGFCRWSSFSRCTTDPEPVEPFSKIAFEH